ncbi:MAG: DDE-type integrase/transposase/recombinase [Micrococcales bacterium]|nr:DDE-type integrase/transposase/recombinase [Micrococcales bacterium]
MTRPHEQAARAERAREVGLFRYALVREAADPALTRKQRGALVRALAAAEHKGPDGSLVRVSRPSLDRWVRAWRTGGFDALVPEPRVVQRRTPQQVLDLAVALKKEVPARTAAQVAAVLAEQGGVVVPSERTLQRHFADLGLNVAATGAGQVFGRFEAVHANDRWTGDAMHGPTVAGKKALLFAFLDDHTRKLVGYRWVRREDTVRAEAALRAAIASHGVPGQVYLDNGAAFVDSQLARAMACLGIRLVHSRPGRPQGRGKIERFFRTVRDQFCCEVGPGRDVADLAELNLLFTAWVETVYHTRSHCETGQSPAERWSWSWTARAEAGLPGPVHPSPDQLREAFLWSAWRTVTKTATVSLEGNTYEVDAALTGRKVELVFDPSDLTRIDVRYDGRPMGQAVPHQVRAHTHPKARPDETDQPPAATGIDYLRLVAVRHEQTLARRIAYADITAAPAGQHRAPTPVEAPFDIFDQPTTTGQQR